MSKQRQQDILKEARKELKLRLAPKRYEHAKSVSETAVLLAKTYGVDKDKARLAGLLHDWDKEYTDKEIRARVRELRMSVDVRVYEEMPRLLHGPTAAIALKQRFPEIEDEVLQAIARHTSGAVHMTDLDMIIYIADVIEPLRTHGGIDTLRGLVGKVSLEALFFTTYKQILGYLIEKNHRIHPDTVTIWNYYASCAKNAAARKGSRD